MAGTVNAGSVLVETVFEMPSVGEAAATVEVLAETPSAEMTQLWFGGRVKLLAPPTATFSTSSDEAIQPCSSPAYDVAAAALPAELAHDLAGAANAAGGEGQMGWALDFKSFLLGGAAALAIAGVAVGIAAIHRRLCARRAHLMRVVRTSTAECSLNSPLPSPGAGVQWRMSTAGRAAGRPSTSKSQRPGGLPVVATISAAASAEGSEHELSLPAPPYSSYAMPSAAEEQHDRL